MLYAVIPMSLLASQSSIVSVPVFTKVDVEPLLESPYRLATNDTDAIAFPSKTWSCAVTASIFNATTSAPISRARYMVDVLFQPAPFAIWVKITPLSEPTVTRHKALM